MFCCICFWVANDNLGAVRIQRTNASKDEVRSRVDERCDSEVQRSEEEKGVNDEIETLEISRFCRQREEYC